MEEKDRLESEQQFVFFSSFFPSFFTLWLILLNNMVLHSKSVMHITKDCTVMSKVLNLILNHVLESRCYIIMHYQNFACVLNLNFIHKHCESFLHVKTHLLREDGGMVLFSFFECETFVFISNFFFAVC